MGYRATPSDPLVTLDIEEFERQAAAFFKANGITDNAGRAAAVAALAPGSVASNNAIKAFLNSLVLKP